METYEKKYKDAQKWIESIYTELSHERQMEAEAFFPELAESEDEKNIKDLIDELKCSLRSANCQNYACNGGHEKRIALLEWAIDWVEKQGDKDKLIKELGEYKVKYTQEVIGNHLKSLNNKENVSISECSSEDVESESEDEWMRKELLTFLDELSKLGKCMNFDRWSTSDVANWIAWVASQREKKTTYSDEKRNVINYIRQETCCGFADTNNALMKLIKVLKVHPMNICDRPHTLKIEWEEKQ